jgi:hypothetical protein
MLDNSSSKVGRRRVSTHISRADLLSVEHVKSGRCDRVGGRVETQVSQHHRRAQNHGGGISLVRPLDILGDVSASRFEECVLLEGS